MILEPTKFDINKFKKPKPKTETTDDYGQQYNADGDNAKWSSLTAADSRKMHSRADTDMGSKSIHHTLGIARNQASPGDHIHDGVNSKLIGPQEMIAGGITQAAWTIPVAATLPDVIDLLHKFIDFREV